MSWHDTLRPGSFRSVPFKALGHGTREGRQGVHKTFPDRDRGWVEDQGLEDARFTIEAYVIGDDCAARRDALRAAMLQPGSGTLIHPWLGSMEVTPEPGAALNLREESGRGRMARMRLSFLAANDTPDFPSASTRAAGSIARDAIALRQAVAESTAAQLDFGGPSWVAEAALADVTREAAAFTAIEPLFAVDAADALFEAGTLAIDIDEIAIEGVANPGAALSRSGAAFLAALNQSVLDFDTSGTAARLHIMGERLFAFFDRGRRVLRSPSGVRLATTRLLDRPVPVASASDLATAAGRRVMNNRIALDRQTRLAAIACQAEALSLERFDGHDAAVIALKAFDRASETLIRAEAADPDIRRGLTDLRVATRETLLANAADAIPVATLHPGTSLPSLVLSWRTRGSLDAAADIVARNGVTNPLFCPARDVLIRAGGINV